MKTVEFKTTDGKTRYYLAGEDGLPVESVMKFLKFRDAAGYASTLVPVTFNNFEQLR